MEFFLYAIFGTADELGFDSTVEPVYRITSDKKVKCDYRYRVKNQATGDDEVFQTIGSPITEDKAYEIVSQATRVWLVRKVISDDGETLVLSEETRILKDGWLFEDARLEKDIQDDIFERISKNMGEAAAEHARQYFLTILHDSVVTSGEGKDDITPVCKPKDQRPVGQVDIVSETTSQEAPSSRHIPRRHGARKHVRTVFKEHCKNVFELTDFGSFIKCLIGCTNGMFTD